MRLLACSFLAALSACTSAPSRPASSRAPDFTLKDLSGAAVTGTSLWTDGPVTLAFMTTWCQTCHEEVPELNAKAASRRVVGILSGDSRGEVEAWRAKYGPTFRVLVDDGKVADAFRVVQSPTVIEVARGGAIVSRSDGAGP